MGAKVSRNNRVHKLVKFIDGLCIGGMIAGAAVAFAGIVVSSTPHIVSGICIVLLAGIFYAAGRDH